MTDGQKYIRQGISGRMPWDSPDSVDVKGGIAHNTPGYVHVQRDSQREIDMCLNCKRPRCINCMGTLTARQRKDL